MGQSLSDHRINLWDACHRQAHRRISRKHRSSIDKHAPFRAKRVYHRYDRRIERQPENRTPVEVTLARTGPAPLSRAYARFRGRNSGTCQHRSLRGAHPLSAAGAEHACAVNPDIGSEKITPLNPVCDTNSTAPPCPARCRIHTACGYRGRPNACAQ